MFNKEQFLESLPLLLYIGGILLGAILLIPISRKLIDGYIQRSNETLRKDPTSFKFLKNSISVIIFLLATVLIVYRIPGGKEIALSLFASAGIFAAIIGFASQSAFSNIISGIFIVIFKPFRVQDLIQIGTDRSGVVEDITLRHTVIRDFENKRIIIPNSVISDETVLNQTITDEKICRHIHFSISYESDINLAKSILKEEAEKHPNCIDNRTPEDLEAGMPVVRVVLLAMEDSGMKLRAYVWSEDPGKSFQLLTELNESVKARFDEAGIEIPYPHRTIVEKKVTK